MLLPIAGKGKGKGGEGGEKRGKDGGLLFKGKFSFSLLLPSFSHFFPSNSTFHSTFAFVPAKPQVRGHVGHKYIDVPATDGDQGTKMRCNSLLNVT